MLLFASFKVVSITMFLNKCVTEMFWEFFFCSSQLTGWYLSSDSRHNFTNGQNSFQFSSNQERFYNNLKEVQKMPSTNRHCYEFRRLLGADMMKRWFLPNSVGRMQIQFIWPSSGDSNYPTVPIIRKQTTTRLSCLCRVSRHHPGGSLLITSS